MTFNLNAFLNQPQNRDIAPNWRQQAFSAATLALAGRLRAQHITAVALWFEDSARFASALFAAWQAECRVLLPPNSADDHRQWVRGQQALWLTDNPDFPDAHWLYDEKAERATGTGCFDIADQAQLCLQTSGSSGAPKTIIKTARQMQDEAQALSRILPDAWRGLPALASVSAQHLYGLTFRIFTALACGWRLERKQCIYPEDLLGASDAPCIWISSPALLNRLGEARDWTRLRRQVRGIVSAGGALPAQTAKLIDTRLGFAPVDIYGSTESGVIASRNADTWQCLPGVAIGLNDDGALWVESPWTAGREQTADAAQIEGDTLRLLGRIDRIIKFEDKRVSLTQIEHCLLAHPWVADAHCGMHHKRIAAWLALNEEGIAILRQEGRAALQKTLQRHVGKSQDTVAIPRYWRFAASLPRNAQAKIRASDFRAAFEEARTTPQWRMTNGDEAARHYHFRAQVPLDLVYFGGHFASFPLVPGVVELQWVMDLAARYPWGRQVPLAMENLKYQQFIRPHDVIDIELRHDSAKNKLHFVIRQGEAVCASGRIPFA